MFKDTRWRVALFVFLSAISCILVVLFLSPVRRDGIMLLGSACIPGDAVDDSRLADTLEDGTPHNQLGGIGSGIAYAGVGNRYLVVADRGPKDGAVSYRCRVHAIEVRILNDEGSPITPRLLETTLLVDEEGKRLVGAAQAIERRYDPEGIRAGADGTMFVVDEYGPSLDVFSNSGRRVRRLSIPEKFRSTNAHGDPKVELQNSRAGRVPNRGFEGLAVSPDRSKLLAAMQSPLIQDGGRDGVNVRLLEFSAETGDTREMVYVLDNAEYGLSEIVAVGEHEFIVIERDGKEGQAAKFKRLFRINTSTATDVSSLTSLPSAGLPNDVRPVRKRLFMDMLDARFGLAGPQFPGKIEGLAFGPDLPDGKRLLLIMSDNDFHTAVPTWIFAFAVDAALLPAR